MLPQPPPPTWSRSASSLPPSLWTHLSPECQRQVAQHLAVLLRRQYAPPDPRQEGGCDGRP